MTRACVIRNTVLFLVSAVLFGLLEGGGHVRFGPPTLWIFVANWHLPMLGLILILAWALDRFQDIPAWVLIEDMSYWVFSGQELAKSSWISMGLSGMTVAGLYLPWTYVLLLVLWGVFVLVRLAYRSYKLKFD